ncbi:MAG: HAMP domain-containing histidine kinase [Planctomycetaceae bacterium]|nr:HAMP domain-containing histidine kinase [Planctomycetaceae bacterium]
MSRPFNRVLIESSLEMKCMLFFGIALSVVIAVSFFLYSIVTNELVQDQNPIMANIWASQHLMEQHWGIFGDPNYSQSKLGTAGADNTVTPRPRIITPDESIKTDFAIKMAGITKRIRNRDSETTYIPNPEPEKTVLYFNAEKARELWKPYKSNLDKFTLLKTDFNPDAPPQIDYKFDEDGTYHYFEEVRMDRRSVCAGCHDFEHGELMGVVHVVIPESSMKKTLQKYWAYLLGAAIISVFLALVTVNVIVRWFVINPLKMLREVSESISRGELTKRADIRTSDEFEVLAEAFNRMLRYLVNTQDMLRKANFELESKVDELAHITIQLYETNRTKSEFMATMSHELKTPLNSILGFSDVLGSISTLNEKQKRYVDNINNSGKSLLSMINNILDMAKMEAGRMEIKTALFNIAATVTAQVDMAKPLVDRKNIALEMVIDSDMPLMRQDESRIQQILNNLLSNAIKFTPEGGRIRVTVQYIPAKSNSSVILPVAGGVYKSSRNRDMLEVKVADTGVGISEEDQQIIFDKFRQGKTTMYAGDTLKREHSGSGLGLSIVREICKILEGEIIVESQLGIGSVFTVKLPWDLESKAKPESEMIEEIRQFAQNRMEKFRIRNAELENNENNQ